MKAIYDLIVRYGTFLLVLLLTTLVAVTSAFDTERAFWLLMLVPLSLLGVWDVVQSRHTLLRNYPLVAHTRWVFEAVRPYVRQYIGESDLSGRPYNREQRSLVYERAKDTVDSQPFGTVFDVYDNQYELMTHSIAARKIEDTDFRICIGGPQCRKPYDASLLNISAMSFGALGGKAIEALNKGARSGGFYQDTGEGGVSPYHRLHGGDLVWEIGTGYFGCRDNDGGFDAELFSREAQREQVKMIEIKLSQGAKPGHGGVLPGEKVTAEIARARRVPVGVECVSPAFHSAFSTPLELLEFVSLLRELSGGKPVGIKLCIGHPWELFAICKAMLKTGVLVDFIVVDGAEGGTGAAPEEFSDHMGMPLHEGLVMTRNALVGTGLRSDIRIAASGKVYSAFSIARNLALGADWCNAARAFMFTLGCVMSKKCHTDKCPTGVATQDPHRQRGLVVEDKYLRVANYHRNTLTRLGELVGAAGLEHPRFLRPHHLHHRTGPNTIATMDKIKDFLEHRILLDDPESTPYAHWWAAATPDSFQPLQSTGPEAET
ncbi:FMN-binding glutamate synthase family protein [Marinobacterium sedimentorum]|uniref:FMN-binding glutamate synthase family protein n=1 Tax=Marinobacterium sedimentorum TaxID=2927804 RepID=UPI0020C6783A|nr:FMN-binding glutamate synthase family protein [Marinobacterium sedimentorum]MCP8687471.1 FMN-binding glutamate synthase family protein [Marinobacterium sedimentorum]